MSDRTYRLLTWIWALIIAILSLMPSKVMAEWTWDQWLALDKWAHAGVYFLLMLLAYRGYRTGGVRKIGVFVVSVIFGVLLEFLQHQMYLGRHFDVLDIIANIIGLIAASVVIWWIEQN